MYYKNNLYSEKGQFCHLVGDIGDFIAYEDDKRMSCSFQEKIKSDENGEYLSEPWFEISQEEWDKVLKDFCEYIKDTTKK